MAIQKVRFNKTTLANFVRDGDAIIVKDSIQKGLRFKVGANGSVFQFEKRISGRKGAPVTFTLGAFPAVGIDDARQEARRLETLWAKSMPTSFMTGFALCCYGRCVYLCRGSPVHLWG